MSAFTIQDDLIEINQYSRPGRPNNPTHIVIHWTGNPNTSAKANRDYFANYCKDNQIYASAHYLIGLKGEIIRCIPENEIAYHAGGRHYADYGTRTFYDIGQRRVYPHNKCIGIENCIPDSTGKFNTETYDSLVQLVADIMKRTGIQIDNVIRHYDITGKNCPKWFVDHEDDWNKFKEDVLKMLTKVD